VGELALGVSQLLASAPKILFASPAHMVVLEASEYLAVVAAIYVSAPSLGKACESSLLQRHALMQELLLVSFFGKLPGVLQLMHSCPALPSKDPCWRGHNLEQTIAGIQEKVHHVVHIFRVMQLEQNAGPALAPLLLATMSFLRIAS